MATGWSVKESQFNSWHEKQIPTISRPDLVITQTPLQWVMQAFPLGIEWLWHRGDSSPIPDAKFKNL